MGFLVFMGVIGAGAIIGIRRLRRNPLLRAIGICTSHDNALGLRRGELIFLPEREGRDRFDPVEVLAARRVA